MDKGPGEGGDDLEKNFRSCLISLGSASEIFLELVVTDEDRLRTLANRGHIKARAVLDLINAITANIKGVLSMTNDAIRREMEEIEEEGNETLSQLKLYFIENLLKRKRSRDNKIILLPADAMLFKKWQLKVVNRPRHSSAVVGIHGAADSGVTLVFPDGSEIEVRENPHAPEDSWDRYQFIRWV